MSTTPAQQNEATSLAKGVSGKSGARVLLAPVVLATSLAALVGGVYYTVVTRPKIDVAGLIHEAAALVEKGEFEGALEHLNEKVIPVVNAGHSGTGAGASSTRPHASINGPRRRIVDLSMDGETRVSQVLAGSCCSSSSSSLAMS